jgi:wyosine [tRNA(Phe)-imidazoG37] synthetase (radical SAM superfamily)
MSSPMFLNAAHFRNTPTHKFVRFLVFEFSLEVFNSSITSLSTTTKREAIVFIAIQNKKLPALASQPIKQKKFCPELRKNALVISQSY